MRPIHAAAIALLGPLIGLGVIGVGLAGPASAAPGELLAKGPLAAEHAPGGDAAPGAAPAFAGETALILAGHENERRRWRHRDRDDDWRDREHRRGHWERDHRRGDWDRHRDRGWDRGRHLGWDRGRGHDWHWGRGHHRDWRWGRGDGRWHDDRWGDHRWRDHDRKEWKENKRWKKKHGRWHLRHHPHHRHWVGRRFAWERYDHIRDHARYGLRPPARGYFYARVDRDVFLVSEAGRRIIDAYVLLDAVR